MGLVVAASAMGCFGWQSLRGLPAKAHGHLASVGEGW
jgi:hypothetical protein